MVTTDSWLPKPFPKIVNHCLLDSRYIRPDPLGPKIVRHQVRWRGLRGIVSRAVTLGRSEWIDNIVESAAVGVPC